METIVSTQYLYPQAVISNGLVTGNSWSNPTNILTVNDLYAESNVSQASDLIVGNFNFNLPTDAVVTGIQFQLAGYAAAITSPLTTLSFNAVDNTSGTNVYHPYTSSFSGLTTSPAFYTFGNSTYLFGTTFTVDQLNNLKLQITSNGNVFVDAVMMQVFYYISTPVVPPTPPVDQTPGYQSQIQALPFELSRPLGATDTKMYLKSFTYPNGATIQTTDIIGGVLKGTIDPELASTSNATGYVENVQFSSWVPTLIGTEMEIDFSTLGNRGRDFKYPYASISGNIVDHPKGAIFIITLNAPRTEDFIQRTESGVTFSPIIPIQYQGTDLEAFLASINFTGTGINVTGDANGNIVVTVNTAAGSGSPGGSSTTLQFNNAGAFGGITGATSDGTNLFVTTQSSADNSTKAASTAYTTTAIANAIAGLGIAISVNVATATVLPNTPTYNNGTAGVGATLTAGANSTLTVDSVVVTINQRVLVKNQASAFQNGVYVLTQAGSGATPWILTRATNFDSVIEVNTSGAIPVVGGSTLLLTSWLSTSTVVTMGTSSINFSQFTVNPSGLVTPTGMQTLANKTWVRRFVAVTAGATPAISVDNTDIASITGLATAITSMTTNLTGTPFAGQYLMIQITDNGTARAIAWGASFQNTTALLPLTTVANALLRVGLQYDTVSAKWQCIATV